MWVSELDQGDVDVSSWTKGMWVSQLEQGMWVSLLDQRDVGVFQLDQGTVGVWESRGAGAGVAGQGAAAAAAACQAEHRETTASSFPRAQHLWRKCSKCG